MLHPLARPLARPRWQGSWECPACRAEASPEATLPAPPQLAPALPLQPLLDLTRSSDVWGMTPEQRCDLLLELGRLVAESAMAHGFLQEEAEEACFFSRDGLGFGHDLCRLDCLLACLLVGKKGLAPRRLQNLTCHLEQAMTPSSRLPPPHLGQDRAKRKEIAALRSDIRAWQAEVAQAQAGGAAAGNGSRGGETAGARCGDSSAGAWAGTAKPCPECVSLLLVLSRGGRPLWRPWFHRLLPTPIPAQAGRRDLPTPSCCWRTPFAGSPSSSTTWNRCVPAGCHRAPATPLQRRAPLAPIRHAAPAGAGLHSPCPPAIFPLSFSLDTHTPIPTPLPFPPEETTNTPPQNALHRTGKAGSAAGAGPRPPLGAVLGAAMGGA